MSNCRVHTKVAGELAPVSDNDDAPMRPRVRLMGSGEGMPALLIYRKAWALLGYLALEPERRHSRLALAVMLWPQFPESAAKTNLRQVLCNLSKYCSQALGEGVLRVERAAVALRRPGRPLFDIDPAGQTRANVQELLSENRVFLGGMDDVAGVDFRIWLEAARQSLEADLMGSAEKCCEQMIAAGRWEEAASLANILLRRDAWNEVHARRAMCAYAGHGMRAAAIAVYERTRDLLLNDLGVEPSEETKQLLARIRSGSGATPASMNAANGARTASGRPQLHLLMPG